MTDFRALCDELVDSIELLLEMRPADAKPLRITEERLSRARAALAEPEPEPPTQRQLLQLAAEFWPEGCEPTQAAPYARAVLARWGTPNLAEIRRSLGGAPQPAVGEVAELAAWLRERGQERETLHLPGAALSKQLRTAPFLLTRAADLLERLSPPQPVPVSERLPGAGDCDAEGRCWLSNNEIEPGWVLDYPERCTNWTHWLPFHALPICKD